MPKKTTKKKITAGWDYNVKLVHTFLFTLLIILLVAVLYMFRPFLIEIVLAGVIASFFYPLYTFLLKYIKSRSLAAIITTVFVAAIIIIPIVEFSVYFINRTVQGYELLVPYLQNQVFIDNIINAVNDGFSFIQLNQQQIVSILLEATNAINGFLLSASRSLVIGTTSFIISMLIIFLTMYYLFVDGKTLARRIMNLTPLPNKYDLQLFKTFREVSYSSLVSTIVIAIYQGVLGGIAFLIIGLPAFFAGVLMGALSIVPYIGPAIVWFPTALFLLLRGDLWQAVVLLVFGAIISFGDNIVRSYLIKGKANVHEMIIFFSLIGGLVVFGFWGIILGPLLIALLFTLIDIYEKEFSDQLEIEEE